MSMDLSNFKLLKEDDNFYQVGHPNGKAITVNKKGLNERAHSAIKKMKGASFDDGGETGVDPSMDAPPQSFASQMASVPEPVMTKSTEPQVAQEPIESPEQPQMPAKASGLEQEMAAIKAEGAAKEAQGKGEAEAIDQHQSAVDELPTPLDIYNANRQKSDALFSKMMNQEIDPNHYWADKSTGSKILAGIGLLFSGMGSATTGQPNYAMESIQKAIDRDIDAQKNSQSKAMNLWKMNREMSNDDVSATLAIKNQLDTGLKYQIMKQGALAQGPIAKAIAARQVGEIQTQIDQRSAAMGLRGALSGSAQPGSEGDFQRNMLTAKTIAPEIAKDAEGKYIPGIGIARVPVKPEDLDAFSSYDGLEKQLARAKNFAATEGTSLPFTDKNQEAHDIQNGIQLEIGRLVGLKRINEFEAKKYTDLVGNPGAFRTSKAIQSFNDLERDIKIHRSAEMNKLGVAPFKKQTIDQSAVNWAKANPNAPQSAAILQVNGVR